MKKRRDFLVTTGAAGIAVGNGLLLLHERLRFVRSNIAAGWKAQRLVP